MLNYNRPVYFFAYSNHVYLLSVLVTNINLWRYRHSSGGTLVNYKLITDYQMVSNSIAGRIMELDEIIITRAIIEEFTSDLLDCTDTDVALVGGGPANLVAAKVLSEAGVRTVLFERKLAIGGGMWGGGMMMPRIVVQEEARRILDDFGVNYTEYRPGYYVADSIECVCRLGAEAVAAGAKGGRCSDRAGHKLDRSGPAKTACGPNDHKGKGGYRRYRA